jgi:biotin operon repressor
MEAKKCYVCGESPLTKDEVGLAKKMFDKKTTVFYCLPCLAEYLEVTEDELLAKIEEFKDEGCTLFE